VTTPLATLATLATVRQQQARRRRRGVGRCGAGARGDTTAGTGGNENNNNNNNNSSSISSSNNNSGSNNSSSRPTPWEQRRANMCAWSLRVRRAILRPTLVAQRRRKRCGTIAMHAGGGLTKVSVPFVSPSRCSANPSSWWLSKSWWLWAPTLRRPRLTQPQPPPMVPLQRPLRWRRMLWGGVSTSRWAAWPAVLAWT